MNRAVCCLNLALIICIGGLGVAAHGAVPMVETTNAGPLCVGRMLAIFPASLETAVHATFDYTESRQPKPVASFEAVRLRLKALSDEYGEKKVTRDPYADKLARAAGLDPNKLSGPTQLLGFREDDVAKQVLIGYQPDTSSIGMIVEVHKVGGGSDYTFRSKFDGADAYPLISQRVWNAALHFQPLTRGEIPTSPGFCVAGGMFADAGHAPLHESFTLVATFKDHPDARFVIDANAINTPDTDEPSLKHRVDSELGILRANVDGHVSVLVRGEREAAGQKGYQIGLSVPNDTVPNTTAYKFFWSADGTPKDATRPALEISLTIQPESDKPASFADAKQVEALWDELLGGLRIRPGSVAR